MSVAEWAETYRYLSWNSALPGRYNLAVTPYLRGILECINDRRVRKVACQKSAQVGWTDGVINNYIGYGIHIDPAPMGVMFPRDQNAKDFNIEKLIPMVEATPVLAELVKTKSRSVSNSQNRKTFDGGFLKFFGSNSTGGVKSTPLKRMVVEEPDDCNLNIKGQGDSIKLAEERVKTFHDSKILVGGTPSIKGVSSIAAEMELSDKRYNYVPCHHCGESHALSWDNVTWRHDETRNHSVYGDSLPETAAYVCPHCGAVWNDAEKNRNVRKGEWRATAEFRGVAGFYLNELYSPFPESKMTRLVEKYLAAVHESKTGEIGALIAFWNSTLGLPWEYQSDVPDADVLKDRCEQYDEWTVPRGALVVTMGVDVQHDRLAVIIRAWGRGEESWLIYWGELNGETLVSLRDGKPCGVWADLDGLIDRSFNHDSGAKLKVRAVSIDSSDGQTADAVYGYVRYRMGKGVEVMAVKGASEDHKEIFSPARAPMDADRQQKAFKYGLRPFIVGVSRAKDLLLGDDARAGRIKLTGAGPGRLHWYAAVRPDYWEQLTSEVKVPHRSIKGKKIWQKKSGVRNEGLDCEIYALHASRAAKIHLFKESHWAALESKLRQQEILIEAHEQQRSSTVEPAAETPSEAKRPAAPAPASKKSTAVPMPQSGGFSATRW